MRTFAIVLFGTLLLASSAHGQTGPENGRREWQVWMGGGHSVRSRTPDASVWNVGGRYGWMLTDPRGPGLLRGRFEYAVDVVPVFWVFQPTGTAYGFGLNPIAFKWNFAQHRNMVPYIEGGGGTLFTTDQVPRGTSRVNFTSGAAIGVHFLRSKYNWTAEVRFMHISNAGLTTPNSGVDMVQVRIGFGRFTRRD